MLAGILAFYMFELMLSLLKKKLVKHLLHTYVYTHMYSYICGNHTLQTMGVLAGYCYK